ncbi:MAG: glycosyltransferase family 39 protein [Bryobacteraceae bacterium]
MAPRFHSALLPVLLALCLVRLWFMPLPSSFWLDEMATVFVAQHGSGHPSLADAAPQAWRSWYYPVIRMNGAVFGYSEVATRMPSILAMAGFLVLLAGLARRLIHPEAAWFAVFACLALPGLNYQAANARPYALGMCAFAAAVLFLVRWLDSGRWRDGLWFAASAALVLYIHLLFWPSCLVLVLYAAVRVVRGETPVNWKRAVLVFALCAAALLPVTAQTLSLLREVRAHVVVPLPSLWQFLRSLEPALVLGCAAALWLIARVLRWRPDARKLSFSAGVLIAGWWLCQPILLYAFSWLTGDAVFVPRYLQLALPGAALASTAVAARFIPAGQWRCAAAVLALGVFLFQGQWRQPWPRHHNSDWRAAARAVNQLEAAGEIPVICPSPFIEARPPAWRPDYPLPGFLYAHLAVYPISGKIYLFPFENSPPAESQAPALAQGALSSSRRFLVYGWGPQVNYWRDWFTRRPEFAGWHERRVGPFADVDVVLFEAPPVLAVSCGTIPPKCPAPTSIRWNRGLSLRFCRWAMDGWACAGRFQICPGSRTKPCSGSSATWAMRAEHAPASHPGRAPTRCALRSRGTRVLPFESTTSWSGITIHLLTGRWTTPWRGEHS